MNWTAGGLAGSVLALIVLETVVSSQANPASGASRLPGLLSEPGKLAADWMSPAIPLIPDRAGKTSAAAPAPAYKTASVTSLAAGTVAGVATNPRLVQLAGRGR